MMTRPDQLLTNVVTLCLAAAVCCAGVAEGQTTRVLVQEGDLAPDGNGTFDHIHIPTLNDAGQAMFIGWVDGSSGGSSDNLGIFRGDTNGPLVQIARAGQPAPDSNGKLSGFHVFGKHGPAFNNEGQVAFQAYLDLTTGGGYDVGGIFLGGNTQGLTQVARVGQFAPDGDVTISQLYWSPDLNDIGQIAFDAPFIGPTGGFSYSAVLRAEESESLTEIVRSGRLAADGNGIFRYFRLGDAGKPAVNNAGLVVFDAYFGETAGGESDDQGIFIGDGLADPVRIVREGQAAPDENGVFSHLNRSHNLSDAGQITFTATLANTSGGQDDNRGIFRGDGATGVVQIARAGQVAPDGDGVLAGFSDPKISDSGRILFNAFLRETSSGIHGTQILVRSDGAENLTQIARTGAPTPRGEGTLSDFSGLSINDQGQAAFVAKLSGVAQQPLGQRGIFFHDDAEGLVEVARTGDPFLGSTIIDLGYSNDRSEIYDRNGLNSHGQVAYAFWLADGNSGIAIWSPSGPGPGDFNRNGVVDAADYTAWRNGLETGAYTAADYDVWRDAYAASLGGGAGGGVVVPEPAAILLGLSAVFGLFGRTRRSGSSSTG